MTVYTHVSALEVSEGKVGTISYARNMQQSITDDLQAINLKKSIAAAFQANFKGTEEEEEIDPQSTHSHLKVPVCYYEDGRDQEM